MNKIRPTTWITLAFAFVNAALIPFSEQPFMHASVAIFAGIAAKTFIRQDRES